MNRVRQNRIIKVITVSAAFVIATSAFLLLFDWGLERYRSPSEKTQVESLEDQVKTDYEASLTLTAERERLTQKSLDRSANSGLISWVLTVGVIVFLIGVNWLDSIAEVSIAFESKLVQLEISESLSSTPGASPVQVREIQAPPEIDLSFVGQVVEIEGQSRDAAIAILRGIQGHYGYLPDEALRRVCELTEITPSQIAGTSSFYAQFRLSPVGKHVVKVCHGTACHVAGVVQISEELYRFLDVPAEADTDPQRLFTLEKVACLGCCSLAPVMMVDEETAGRLTPATARDVINKVEPEAYG